MVSDEWRLRLGRLAERDFADILEWTAEHFGVAQARVYQDTLVRAIAELSAGPDVAGSKARDDIMRGLRTLHVARHGRRGRHVILYRVAGERMIEIGRILHDQMDHQRHLPFPPDDRDA